MTIFFIAFFLLVQVFSAIQGEIIMTSYITALAGDSLISVFSKQFFNDSPRTSF